VKYIVTCPYCGYRLLRAEEGTILEMECHKCGAPISVVVQPDDLHLTKPIRGKPKPKEKIG